MEAQVDSWSPQSPRKGGTPSRDVGLELGAWVEDMGFCCHSPSAQFHHPTEELVSTGGHPGLEWPQA